MNAIAVDSTAEGSLAGSTKLIEHRRHERSPLHSLVRLSYLSDPTQVGHLGRGVDISDSGLSFVSESVLDFHRVMVIEYTDMSGVECRRPARLMYRMNHTYGAYFLDAAQSGQPR